MSMPAKAVPDEVVATLNYLVPMAGKPVSYTYEPPPGVPWRTGLSEPHAVAIRNARQERGAIALDEQGFALVRHRSAVADFYDEAEVRRVLYPEVAQLLTRLTGARRALIFDHNVRNAAKAGRREDGAKEPVRRVHNDFTLRSGPERAAAVLAAAGEEPAAALEGRFALVNLWRPIRGPVEDTPLAVCDARTIAPGDWVPADLVYRDRVGETYSVGYNPAHRWYYVPAMAADEALLIKCYDSAADGRARFAAHSAFDDPTSRPDAAPRESIEVRTLVLFD